MDEKSLIRIFLSFTVMLASWSVDGHQPVLNSESRTAKSPYIIEEPEISKAIFSELMGESHYYRIESDSRFEFYVGITVPKIDNCPISKNDPTAHAEIEVLRKAGKKLLNYRLPKTTLYVTLEPCTMCLGAMIHARIERVVFGASDPKSGVCGSTIDLSSESIFNHQISVSGGVLEHECKNILQSFFKLRRK